MSKTTLGVEPTQVFCKDCRWFSGENEQICRHDKATIFDPVMGARKQYFAAAMRAGICGPNGKLYEPAAA